MTRASLIILAAALIAPTALAQDTAPDTLVKGVTQEVLGVIKQDKDIQAGNQRKTIALVEEKVLPHFNFARMTALAMGPNWRKATPEQQKALIEQFRTLLVRTYSSALSSYRNQMIDFKPLRAAGERRRRGRAVRGEAARRRSGIDRLQHGEDARRLEGVRRRRRRA